MQAMSLITTISFVFILYLPVSAKADSWDDFTNNLATDLAPLIALFGEQVTKQFLSESTTFLDTIIFAAAPLGILTAVVSAIRVCGNTSLRAFVGRAQEGRGNVEAELCSSTSSDVCELWNRGGIARVLGNPKILEFVHDKSLCEFYEGYGPNSNTDYSLPSAGLFLPEHYFGTEKARSNRWEEKGSVSKYQRLCAAEDEATAPLIEANERYFAPKPNLSLNIGIKRHPTALLWAIALFGCLLQSSVLVFSYWVTYIARYSKDGEAVKGWGFPLATMGTCFLAIGVGMCAWLVDRSTKERCFKRKPPSDDDDDDATHFRMFWLQPGNQSVGDQTFDAFAFHSRPNRHLTSWRSSRKSSVKDLFLVCSAVGLAVIGFVLQFVGTRALHASVALYQLGATLLMSFIRAFLRSDRMDQESNLLRDRADVFQGHELDWQAFEIEKSEEKLDFTSIESWQWNIIGPVSRDVCPTDVSIDSTPNEYEHQATFHRTFNDNLFLVIYKPTATFSDRSLLEQACVKIAVQWISELECEAKQQRPHFAARVLYFRSRLAALTGNSLCSNTEVWHTEVREFAGRLQKAIEGTAEYIFSHESKMCNCRAPAAFFWRLGCSTAQPKEDIYPIFFLMHRSSDRWHIESCILEAALGLWTWSLRKDIVHLPHPLRKSFAVGSPEELERSEAVFKLWVPQGSKPMRRAFWEAEKGDSLFKGYLSSVLGHGGSWGSLSLPIYQLFNTGKLRPAQFAAPDIGSIYQDTTSPLIALAAQDLFVSFLTSLADVLGDMDDIVIRPIQPRSADEPHAGICLSTGHVDNLVKIFAESGIGSQEEGYISIISALHAKMRVPPVSGKFDTILDHAKDAGFEDAEDSLRYLYFESAQRSDSGSTQRANIAAQALDDLYWRAIKQPDKSVQLFGCDGINWMLQKQPANDKMQKAAFRALQYFLVTGDIDSFDAFRGLLRPNLAAEIKDWVSGDRGSFLSMYKRANSLLADRTWNPVVDKNESSNMLVASVILGCHELLNDLFYRLPIESREKMACALLSLAIKMQDADTARVLIDLCPSCVSLHLDSGRSPLSWAAGEGAVDIMPMLLVMGASEINAKDVTGRTPLSWAAGSGQSKVITMLVSEQNADVNSRDNSGRTPLSWAAGNGQIDSIKKLISVKGITVDCKDDKGRTPLLWAVYNGHISVVELLLDHVKVDIESQDSTGATALLLASQTEHEALIKFLCNRHANMRVADNKGRNLISWLAMTGKAALLQVLLNENIMEPDLPDDDGRTPLSLAVSNGHQAVVQLLLSQANVNADFPDNNGKTPFLWAAQTGNYALINILIEHGGIDINAKDNGGHTLVFWLALLGDCKLIKNIFGNNKIDPNMADHDGRTLLSWAAEFDQQEVVRLLLQRGDVHQDCPDKTGKTPLLWAAKAKNEIVIEMLLNKGNVNLNAKDNRERALLSWLAETGSRNLIKRLLDGNNNIDLNARDDQGRTPLFWAVMKGHHQTVKLFIDHADVDPNLPDRTGRTPLSWIRLSGNKIIEHQLYNRVHPRFAT